MFIFCHSSVDLLTRSIHSCNHHCLSRDESLDKSPQASSILIFGRRAFQAPTDAALRPLSWVNGVGVKLAAQTLVVVIVREIVTICRCCNLYCFNQALGVL